MKFSRWISKEFKCILAFFSKSFLIYRQHFFILAYILKILFYFTFCFSISFYFVKNFYLFYASFRHLSYFPPHFFTFSPLILHSFQHATTYNGYLTSINFLCIFFMKTDIDTNAPTVIADQLSTRQNLLNKGIINNIDQSFMTI